VQHAAGLRQRRRLPDDLEVGFALEHRGNRLTHDGVILHQEDPYRAQPARRTLADRHLDADPRATSALAGDVKIGAEQRGPLPHPRDACSGRRGGLSPRVEATAVVGDLDANVLARAPCRDADARCLRMAACVGQRLADQPKELGAAATERARDPILDVELHLGVDRHRAVNRHLRFQHRAKSCPSCSSRRRS